MKSILFATMVAISSPGLAQSATTACPHCEQAKMDCCERGPDGKMQCKMMKQGQMDHGGANHSADDHATMQHSAQGEPQPR